MIKIRFLLLLLAVCVLGMHAAEAQLPRSARSIVRGGMFQKPDSLRAKRDSIRFAELALRIDSAQTVDYAADSAAVAALRTDDLRLLDPTLYLRFKTSPAQTGTYLFTVTMTCAERTISQTFPLTF